MLRRASLYLQPTHKVTEHRSLQPEARIKQLFNTKGGPDLLLSLPQGALSTPGFVLGGCDPEAAVAPTPPQLNQHLLLGDLCHLALHHPAGKGTEESKGLNYNKQQRPGKGEMQQSNLQAQVSDHWMDREPFPLQNSGFFPVGGKLRLLASSMRGLCFGLKALNTSSSLPLEAETELEEFFPSGVKLLL